MRELGEDSKLTIPCRNEQRLHTPETGHEVVTLAPWNPTQKLVVHGIYRYVRNPMITGMFCILLGEAIFFGSWWLLGWFGFFVLVNVIYIPLLEEPGLARRFGNDYLLYRRNVPRWIPRLTPWEELPEPANARQEGGHYE